MTQQANAIPNVYEFTGEEIQITFSLSEDASPALDYRDAQQTLSFVDAQVRRQQSELGDLISVTLHPTVDAGATTLTLLLPPINMAGQNEQRFHTLAIVTQSFGILPHTGAKLTYRTLQLHGVAKLTTLPGE